MSLFLSQYQFLHDLKLRETEMGKFTFFPVLDEISCHLDLLQRPDILKLCKAYQKNRLNLLHHRLVFLRSFELSLSNLNSQTIKETILQHQSFGRVNLLPEESCPQISSISRREEQLFIFPPVVVEFLNYSFVLKNSQVLHSACALYFIDNFFVQVPEIATFVRQSFIKQILQVSMELRVAQLQRRLFANKKTHHLGLYLNQILCKTRNTSGRPMKPECHPDNLSDSVCMLFQRLLNRLPLQVLQDNFRQKNHFHQLFLLKKSLQILIEKRNFLFFDVQKQASELLCKKILEK